MLERPKEVLFDSLMAALAGDPEGAHVAVDASYEIHQYLGSATAAELRVLYAALPAVTAATGETAHDPAALAAYKTLFFAVGRGVVRTFLHELAGGKCRTVVTFCFEFGSKHRCVVSGVFVFYCFGFFVISIL